MIILNNEKRKRVSKKRKSSWRKHVHVEDVNDFLEEKRLEERLGEPLSLLKDDQIFTIQVENKEKQLSNKEKKRLRLAAPPKCFAMLQPHTKVPDPIKKRNHVRTKQERMCPILKRKEQERKAKGLLKTRELQSINDRINCEKKRNEKNNESTEDIWTVEDNLDNNPWIEKDTKRHTLRWTGKLNKIVPRLKSDKNTFIPSVEIPHPGTSYNPSFEDHSNLLKEIVEKEAKIIKEEQHLQRVTKDMFRKVTAEANEKAWMSEMRQGLPEAEETSAEAKEAVNNEKPYKSINPPVENKKKTLKQRRKQKEQVLLKKERLLAKMEKKKTVDIHKLKMIKEQIAMQENKLEKVKIKKQGKKLLKQKEPKQLSKLKYEDPDVDFNMGQDLTGNLRNLKKEGNLLRDRFHSFQKRNILEVSARQNRKKTKVKKFVKPGFRDDWKKTVASKTLLSTNSNKK